MKKLIIIDDSPDDLEWLADLAAQAGWTDVATFDRAENAYALLDPETDITILLDYKLKVRLGIVHLGAIWARAPEASVILVTGIQSESVKQVARTLGTGFISKSDISAKELKFALDYTQQTTALRAR